MSTERIYEAVIRASAGRLVRGGQGLRHLDIGAGQGELIERLRSRYACDSHACDFHVERFPLSDVPIASVDLNTEPLPYAEGAFDLVTCSEVLEHLENFRGVLREAYRVLKPGGLLVVTTPNVVNAYSRARYLVSGFATLFGPLPTKHDERHTTGAHITPIAYFYLAHALTDAGFADIRLGIDKIQRTSVLLLALFFPIVLLGWLRFLQVERRKYRTITPDNEAFVKQHFSREGLLGRTIVVSACKPAG